MKPIIIILLLVIAFLLYRNTCSSLYGGEIYAACGKGQPPCNSGLSCMKTKNYGNQCR